MLLPHGRRFGRRSSQKVRENPIHWRKRGPRKPPGFSSYVEHREMSKHSDVQQGTQMKQPWLDFSELAAKLLFPFPPSFLSSPFPFPFPFHALVIAMRLTRQDYLTMDEHGLSLTPKTELARMAECIWAATQEASQPITPQRAARGSDKEERGIRPP